MRPPGYVRPLPFDSIDHLLAVLSVDHDAGRGFTVLAGSSDVKPPDKAPEGEYGTVPTLCHRHEEHYLEIVFGPE